MIDKNLAWKLTTEPRVYQTEATEWALARGQAVCSLPTGTGKTLVAVLWLLLRTTYKNHYNGSKSYYHSLPLWDCGTLVTAPAYLIRAFDRFLILNSGCRLTSFDIFHFPLFAPQSHSQLVLGFDYYDTKTIGETMKT